MREIVSSRLPLTTSYDMRQDTVPTRENFREIFDKVGFVPLDIHLSYPKTNVKSQPNTRPHLNLILTLTSPLPRPPPT